MVKGLKTFIAGFVVCSILFGGVVALAAGDVQIKATLQNTFKFKLYGKDYAVKGGAGSYAKPIYYNKTSYIPIQAVVNGIGVPVEYDAAHKTIWLGGKMEKVPVNSKTFYNDYYDSIVTKDPNKLSTPEANYKWGIANAKTLDMETFGCYLTPKSKYNRFKASLFIDENVKMPLVIQFLKDNYSTGEALATYELQPGKTQDIEFDIGGVDKFYVIASVKIGHGTIEKLVIGEPVFFNEKEEHETNEANNDVIK